jgi:hypothetical protein
VVDQTTNTLDLARRGTSRVSARICEVVRVETPEWLDRGVEGATGQLGDTAGGFQDRDELQRWPEQAALPVQDRQGRVPVLQAEDAFEPVDLGDAERHQPPGRVGPLQPEVDASLGAQGRATPPETPESSLKLETRQETEAEGASNDGDEATSLHDQAVEVTLATP